MGELYQKQMTLQPILQEANVDAELVENDTRKIKKQMHTQIADFAAKDYARRTQLNQQEQANAVDAANKRALAENPYDFEAYKATSAKYTKEIMGESPLPVDHSVIERRNRMTADQVATSIQIQSLEVDKKIQAQMQEIEINRIINSAPDLATGRINLTNYLANKTEGMSEGEKKITVAAASFQFALYEDKMNARAQAMLESKKESAYNNDLSIFLAESEDIQGILFRSMTNPNSLTPKEREQLRQHDLWGNRLFFNHEVTDANGKIITVDGDLYRPYTSDGKSYNDGHISQVQQARQFYMNEEILALSRGISNLMEVNPQLGYEKGREIVDNIDKYRGRGWNDAQIDIAKKDITAIINQELPPQKRAEMYDASQRVWSGVERFVNIKEVERPDGTKTLQYELKPIGKVSMPEVMEWLDTYRYSYFDAKDRTTVSNIMAAVSTQAYDRLKLGDNWVQPTEIPDNAIMSDTSMGFAIAEQMRLRKADGLGFGGGSLNDVVVNGAMYGNGTMIGGIDTFNFGGNKAGAMEYYSMATKRLAEAGYSLGERNPQRIADAQKVLASVGVEYLYNRYPSAFIGEDMADITSKGTASIMGTLYMKSALLKKTTNPYAIDTTTLSLPDSIYGSDNYIYGEFNALPTGASSADEVVRQNTQRAAQIAGAEARRQQAITGLEENADDEMLETIKGNMRSFGYYGGTN